MGKNGQDKEGVEDVSELSEGERILYGEKKTPLTVKQVEEGEAKVEGPKGGEYLLYNEQGAKHPLVSKPGNKRYASYAENLRKVGEWNRKDEKTWKHTGTKAKIQLVTSPAGFWTLDTENFDEDLDLPRYGFSNLENAKEEAEKILEKNPEG